MKTYKILKPIFLSLFITVGFSACKKSFLETTPKGKLIAKKTNDYSLLLNNLDLINQVAADFIPMGDEWAGLDPYFSGAQVRTQRVFRWDDVLFEPEEDAWEITYPLKALYVYNKIINEVMQSTDGTEQQKKSLRAEALGGRAFSYYLLINFFGKPYNNATSATDPGFPIIKAADVSQTSFNRASVKEVYDFMVNDLTTAIPDLPAQPTHRIRMSRPAAEGLLAKIYVFMGKFNEALPLFNSCISACNSSTYPVRLYDYNIVLSPGGSFLPITPSGPTFPLVPNNEECLYGRQTISSWTSSVNNEMVLSPQTVALYGNSDLRRKFMSATPYPSGTTLPLGMLRRIGPLATPFLVLPDMYLLRAEVKARLNDLSGAEADLEYLRARRMPAADAPVSSAIATDRIALLKFIFEERIREWSGSGYRWFDMRRLSVDPEQSLRATINTTHVLYSATGAVLASYTLKPERLTFKIPPKVLSENPGMVDNP